MADNLTVLKEEFIINQLSLANQEKISQSKSFTPGWLRVIFHNERMSQQTNDVSKFCK